MKNKRLLMFSIVCATLSSCNDIFKRDNGNKIKGAVYIEDIEDSLNKDFMKNNLIKNLYYDEYDIDTHKDTKNVYPEERYFVIKDEEMYSNYFNNGSDIDFSKNMYVIYSCYRLNIREQVIDEVTLDDKTLHIYIGDKIKNISVPDTCIPYQNWCGIILESVEFDTILFN